jgi:hypothetical protein
VHGQRHGQRGLARPKGGTAKGVWHGQRTAKGVWDGQRGLEPFRTWNRTAKGGTAKGVWNRGQRGLEPFRTWNRSAHSGRADVAPASVLGENRSQFGEVVGLKQDVGVVHPVEEPGGGQRGLGAAKGVWNRSATPAEPMSRPPQYCGAEIGVSSFSGRNWCRPGRNWAEIGKLAGPNFGPRRGISSGRVPHTRGIAGNSATSLTGRPRARTRRSSTTRGCSGPSAGRRRRGPRRRGW